MANQSTRDSINQQIQAIQLQLSNLQREIRTNDEANANRGAAASGTVQAGSYTNAIACCTAISAAAATLATAVGTLP